MHNKALPLLFDLRGHRSKTNARRNLYKDHGRATSTQIVLRTTFRIKDLRAQLYPANTSSNSSRLPCHHNSSIVVLKQLIHKTLTKLGHDNTRSTLSRKSCKPHHGILRSSSNQHHLLLFHIFANHRSCQTETENHVLPPPTHTHHRQIHRHPLYVESILLARDLLGKDLHSHRSAHVQHRSHFHSSRLRDRILYRRVLHSNSHNVLHKHHRRNSISPRS